MKKIIGLLVVLIAIGAGLFYFMRTTTLTVNAVLVADGLDVTDQMYIQVGLIDDTVAVADMNTVNMQELRAVDGTDHTYTVPAGQRIGIYANAQGYGPIRDVVTLDAGATEAYTFVLDAGLVEINVTPDPSAGQTRVKHLPSSEGIGPELDPSGTQTYIVPAGAQTFEANQEFTTVTATIDVVAGETHSADIDLRHKDVTMAIATDLTWSDDFPEIGYRLVGAGGFNGGVVSRDGARATFRDVPFGTYEAFIAFLPSNGPRILRNITVGPIETVIDTADADVLVDVPLVILNTDLSTWAIADLQDADVMVRGIRDVGLAYAAAKADVGTQTLVFLQSDPADLYAIVVARGSDVLAVQEIGQIEPNNPLDLNVTQGGDVALCEAVTEVANCDALQP